MFTSGDSSNIMLVSNKPIKGSTINDALKVCDNLYDFHNSILNETSLLEYDKIYNETHSIDRIYNETIKDNVAQLFHKKNSCVFFFGPGSGGKSYLLIGEKDGNSNDNNQKNYYYTKNNFNSNRNKDNQKTEGGLLRRSINNILNLIKINNQGNDDESDIKNKFELRLSIYQIYMEKIYDLLSKNINNISIKQFYDEEQNMHTNLVGLTDIEIRSIQEYEKILKEIEYNKQNISKTLKIKNIFKKSHIIFSLKLQKKIQNILGSNITDNYSINSFSQIDFVELVRSDIGLSDKFKNNNDLSYEYNLYANTKNVFNSICDNIVSANNGSTPNNNTILTLSLKNTLKTNSNIIFFNCVIPWEFPLFHSFKALKFTTWLRNKVINEGNNNISINKANNQSINPNSSIINNNNLFNTMNENKNNSYMNNYNNMTYNANKTFPEISNYQTIDNGNKNNNILIKEEKNAQNENNHFNINEEHNIKLMRSRSGGLNINNNKTFCQNNKSTISQALDINNQNNNKSQYNNIYQNLSQNEKTLQTLEQTLKELEDKKREIKSRIIEEKKRNVSNNYSTIPSQNLINQDNQKLKEEQDILKSDNIIMKEEISRLDETNQNLENEISQNREIISKLQSENQHLNDENSLLRTKINDYDSQNYSQLYINGQISKEDFLQKSFNERYLLHNKLKDLENNYNIIQKEKMQYEINYKVLLSKYEEIKEKYDKINYDLMNNRQMHDNELYNIDNKINGLSKDVQRLQMENTELRQDNEKQRNNINILISERDMYKEKYEDQKYKNDLLNKKIFEVENGFNEMMKRKDYERNYKREKEETKINKNETKTKIAQELKSKIQKFRRERFQNRNNEEFD